MIEFWSRNFLLLLIHQQVEAHVEKTLKNTWTKFHILHPQKDNNTSKRWALQLDSLLSALFVG